MLCVMLIIIRHRILAVAVVVAVVVAISLDNANLQALQNYHTLLPASAIIANTAGRIQATSLV